MREYIALLVFKTHGIYVSCKHSSSFNFENSVETRFVFMTARMQQTDVGLSNFVESFSVYSSENGFEWPRGGVQ